jgi:hypothetical protein
VIGLVSVEGEEEELVEQEGHDEEAAAFLRRPSSVEPVVESVVADPSGSQEDSALWEEASSGRESTGDRGPRSARPERPRAEPRRDENEDSDLWAEAPRSRPRRDEGGRRGGLSRGRPPSPAFDSPIPPRSARPEIPSSRGGRPPASSVPPSREDPGRRARELERGTGSVSSSGSALIGRRPLRPRAQLAQDAPQKREREDTPDPFGEESLGLGNLEPSRPHPSATPAEVSAEARPEPEKAKAKKAQGGLRRGRRPQRKP